MGIAIGLESMRSPIGEQIVLNPGIGFRLMTTITLTTGAILLMWVGEQITERGIGNGISLLIFAGIIVRMPEAIVNTWRLLATGELKALAFLIVLVLMVLVVAAIMFIAVDLPQPVGPRILTISVLRIATLSDSMASVD